MQIVVTQKMCFGRPVTTPKHYLSTGASGWLETFERKDADKSLQKFIGHRPIHDMVLNFIDHIESSLEKKKASWSDVLSYISRIVRVHPDKIPCDVAVAFWAYVTAHEDDKGQN